MRDRKRKRLLAAAALVLAAVLAGWCLAGPLEILQSEYALQRNAPAAVWKLYEHEPGRPVLQKRSASQSPAQTPRIP